MITRLFFYCRFVVGKKKCRAAPIGTFHDGIDHLCHKLFAGLNVFGRMFIMPAGRGNPGKTRQFTGTGRPHEIVDGPEMTAFFRAQLRKDRFFERGPLCTVNGPIDACVFELVKNRLFLRLV